MNGRGPITTHILDLAAGRPAAGVEVALEVAESGGWRALGQGRTDADGRIQHLLAAGTRLEPGAYRLTFAVIPYFAERGESCFYPEVAITFLVQGPVQHYHVPLLLSPFGYSTYRGS